MAKKITGYIKLQVPAGAANPAPPNGPALGQRGLKITEFCKALNSRTAQLEKGSPIPLGINAYQDRSFTFSSRPPPSTLLLKKSDAKLGETVELSTNLGADPKHADQMVRGVVNLPNGTGRTLRVAVFARGAKADEARAAGADVVGAEDLVAAVQGGEINFDRCIATPDLMPLVGRLGKVLGPRGLMPNPKVGTVTMDVKAAVAASKGGAVEFRAEKAGIVQGSVGKASFGEDKLAENIRAFVDAVNRAKPPGAKGHYLLRAAVSSTMGPGVRLDLGTLGAAASAGG